MSGHNQYLTKDFIDAIPGSGGIITTIARRVGCNWRTARKYVTTYPTVRDVYDDECQKLLDMAEGVVVGNIELAKEAIEAGNPADSSDAKWVLTRLGKDRGYAERQEVTGAGGGPLLVGNVQLTEAQQERALKQLAEIYAKAGEEQDV